MVKYSKRVGARKANSTMSELFDDKVLIDADSNVLTKASLIAEVMSILYKYKSSEEMVQKIVNDIKNNIDVKEVLEYNSESVEESTIFVEIKIQKIDLT